MMKSMCVIETERLLLRRMTPDDFDALYAIWSDADVMRHYPSPFDAEKVMGWIQRNIERYRVFGFGLWAVVLKQTGLVIGDCGLTMQPIHGEIKPEIGYHIHKDFQRQGYGGEAARAVRDWGFTHTPFGALYSYMKHTNAASAATAMLNGMRLVDQYEDAEDKITKVYEITREEWERR